MLILNELEFFFLNFELIYWSQILCSCYYLVEILIYFPACDWCNVDDKTWLILGEIFAIAVHIVNMTVILLKFTVMCSTEMRSSPPQV